MEYNILKITFVLMSLLTLLLSSLVNYCSKYTPDFIQQMFRYGKFSHKEKTRLVLEVPKSWFRHFYIFASIWSLLGTILATMVYFTSCDVPLPIINLLNFFDSNHRTTRINATSAYIAMILITIQSWKRLYETFYVNIFSNSKMNVSHYFIGYIHYFGTVIAILVEAPGFSNKFNSEFSSTDFKPMISLLNLTGKEIICSIIFFWACFYQLKSSIILSSLRKNKKGEVVTMKHKIPYGGLFEYVSSPHLMCEMLMYICLTVILWGTTTWLYILIWVISNQIETALLSHWWYQSNFKEYPKNRYAVIPFIL